MDDERTIFDFIFGGLTPETIVEKINIQNMLLIMHLPLFLMLISQLLPMQP